MNRKSQSDENNEISFEIEWKEWIFNFSNAGILIFWKTSSENFFLWVEFWTNTSIDEESIPEFSNSTYFSINILSFFSTLI